VRPPWGPGPVLPLMHVLRKHALTAQSSPIPPVATRFSRFRQFVDRFHQNPVKIHRKIEKFPRKEHSDQFRRHSWRGGSGVRNHINIGQPDTCFTISPQMGPAPLIHAYRQSMYSSHNKIVGRHEITRTAQEVWENTGRGQGGAKEIDKAGQPPGPALTLAWACENVFGISAGLQHSICIRRRRLDWTAVSLFFSRRTCLHASAC
jgi:hypothetical protein